MNFLSNVFGSSNQTNNINNNSNSTSGSVTAPTASLAPMGYPSALPPNSSIIAVDDSLFATFKSVNEAEFDLPSLTKTVFKTIYASSVEGKQGIKNNFLLKHQFLALANIAFDNHYGFILNPSQLFLLITQQIALHVNDNSEALRSQFVAHDGKKDLTMEIPAVPSREEWAGIIENFQSQIAANTVPDTKALMTLTDFESAGHSEKIAGDVVFMDMCQAFFEYKMYTRCGIPFFVLEGAESDWALLREKAEQAISRKTLPKLSNFWLSALLPTLDKLLAARRGEVDRSFWQNFYKRGAKGGSGGYTFVNGWINAFFPLTNENRENAFCKPWSEAITEKPSHDKGLDVQDFVSGVASAPVLWTRMGEKIPMRFCAGFVGGTIVHDNSLRPEVAWWVGPVDETPQEEGKGKGKNRR